MTLQKHMRKRARAKMCCLSGHVVEPSPSWVQQLERCRRAAVGGPQLAAKFKRQEPAWKAAPKVACEQAKKNDTGNT